MRTIRTSAGYEILIDDEDFDLVSQFNWLVMLHGKKTKKPRVYMQIGGRKRRQRVYLSRLLLREPPGTVDHENGDTLDHRRLNLRNATQKQNSRNRVKYHTTTSKYKGVSLRKNRRGGPYKSRPWAAFITVDRRRIKVGFFGDEVEAAKAYDTAALRHFGEFARPNFV